MYVYICHIYICHQTDACITFIPPTPHQSILIHHPHHHATYSAPAPTTNKLGLALLPPNIEVDVSQQRVQYGIGVLHNKVLRRGIDPSLVVEPPTVVAAGRCVCVEGVGSSI